MADFDVSVGADFSELESDFAKLPDKVAKEFKGVGKAIEKELKKPQAEAKRLGRALDNDVGKKAKASFQSAKEAAEGFGGTVGGSVGAVEKFGKSVIELSTAFGPLAAVAGGTALALGGVAIVAGFVTKEFLEAAAAARDFAEENEDLVPPETLEALNRFDDSMSAIANSGKVVGAILIGDVAEGLDEVTFLAVKAGLIIQDQFGENGIIRRALAATADGITDQVLGPFAALASLVSGELVDGSDLAAKAIDGLNDATSDYNERAEALIAREREKREATDQSTASVKAADDAARSFIKALQEQEKAQAALTAITRQANEDLLTDSDRIELAFQDRERAILDVAFAARDLEGVQAAFAANEARRARDMVEIDRAALEERAALHQSFWDDVQRMAQEESDAEIAMRKEVALAVGRAGGQALGAFADFSAARQNLLQDKLEETNDAIKAARERGDMQEVAALKRRQSEQQALIVQSFKAEKALSIAEAAVNGAVAFTQALASAPPPINAILAAGVAASVAGQIALIQSQRPPTFQTGSGMIGREMDGDHVLVGVSRNEGVLKPEGVAAAGGPEAVDRLNAGIPSQMAVTIEMPGAGAIARAIVNDPSAVRIIAREVMNSRPRGSF